MGYKCVAMIRQKTSGESSVRAHTVDKFTWAEKLLSSIGEVGAGGGIRTHAMPGWKPGAFPLGDARLKIGPGSGS